jgi:hypothetical protein
VEYLSDFLTQGLAQLSLEQLQCLFLISLINKQIKLKLRILSQILL